MGLSDRFFAANSEGSNFYSILNRTIGNGCWNAFVGNSLANHDDLLCLFDSSRDRNTFVCLFPIYDDNLFLLARFFENMHSSLGSSSSVYRNHWFDQISKILRFFLSIRFFLFRDGRPNNRIWLSDHWSDF